MEYWRGCGRGRAWSALAVAGSGGSALVAGGARLVRSAGESDTLGGRASGGIGRRAGFRFQCPRRVGSSPISRTTGSSCEPSLWETDSAAVSGGAGRRPAGRRRYAAGRGCFHSDNFTLEGRWGTAPAPRGTPVSLRWSKMRLSPGRERGLSGHLVQNASESTRIRLDPAKTARLRRILDQPAAVTPRSGETQTHFGPSPRSGGGLISAHTPPTRRTPHSHSPHNPTRRTRNDYTTPLDLTAFKGMSRP